MRREAYPEPESQDKYTQDCKKCNHGVIVRSPKWVRNCAFRSKWLRKGAWGVWDRTFKHIHGVPCWRRQVWLSIQMWRITAKFIWGSFSQTISTLPSTVFAHDVCQKRVAEWDGLDVFGVALLIYMAIICKCQALFVCPKPNNDSIGKFFHGRAQIVSARKKKLGCFEVWPAEFKWRWKGKQ